MPFFKRQLPPENLLLDQRNRIVFLDYLRAIACLLVVFGHIYVVGLGDFNTIKNWLPNISANIFGDAPNIFLTGAYHVAVMTGVNVGSLGVGVFFLLSGFVILGAVDREPAWRFFARRFFRIFPTCAAVVFLTAATMAIYCWHFGVANPNTIASTLASGAVVLGFTGHFPTIPVLWTLEIELFFYLVIGLASFVFGYVGRGTLLLMTAACALLSAATHMVSLPIWLIHIGSMMNQVTLILIGSMIYRAYQSRWSPISCLYVVGSILVFYMSYRAYAITHKGGHEGIDMRNAVVAFGVFMAALMLKMRWEWIRPLKWFGDISYPLYLVHIPLGWVIIEIFASFGYGQYSSSFASVVLIIVIAWGLHVSIEKPSQAIARYLTRKRVLAVDRGAPNSEGQAVGLLGPGHSGTI